MAKDRRVVFVLAACDDGPMILSRIDYAELGRGLVKGVGLTLLDEGSHSQHCLDILIQLSHERRKRESRPIVVLDCGANVGSFTVGWAKAIEGWGNVLAFEAQERVFYALAGNLALNNVFNARAVWAAVSDDDGSMKQLTVDYRQPAHISGVSMLSQFNDDVGQQPSVAAQRVRTICIDSLGLAHVDLIKVDVEGMEDKVLRGGYRIIDRCRPVVLAEWIFSDPDSIMKLLPKDYRHVVVGGDLLAMPADDPAWTMIEIKQHAA